MAKRLLTTISAGHVLADKAYDSDDLRTYIELSGAQPVIPYKSNRKSPKPVDQHRYKTRNRIERFFGKLKEFRRIATRYDKLARRFASFILLVGAILWGSMN